MALTALALVLAYVTFTIHIEGRTPYGHFRAAGGEDALLDAWGWTRSTAGVFAEGAWYYSKEAGYAVVSWVSRSAGAASRAARAGWDAWWEDDGRPRRRDRYRPREGPPAKVNPARARVRSLSAADGRKPVSPASKRATRVDRHLDPNESAALDRKLSGR